MLQNTFGEYQSTLIQVKAWCCQTTNHYLSQYWPISMLPYGVTMSSQWSSRQRVSGDNYWGQFFVIPTVRVTRLNCINENTICCGINYKSIESPTRLYHIDAFKAQEYIMVHFLKSTLPIPGSPYAPFMVQLMPHQCISLLTAVLCMKCHVM